MSMINHVFQIHEPPIDIITRIGKIFNKFLWGSQNNNTRKTHLAAWDTLCLPWGEGGIGFRKLKDIIITFSQKLWWKIRKNDSLWTKYMNVKYCLGIHPLFAPVKNTSSVTWVRVSKTKNSAEKYIVWEIGPGNISFWHDNWLGSSSLSQILPTYQHDNKEVAEFLTDHTWDTRKIQFLSCDINMMVSNVPIGIEILDRCIFTLTKSQSFEFKATWQEIGPRGVNLTIGPFWSRALPIKMSFFIWHLIKKFLPAETVMQNRCFHLASKCRCCANIEIIDHLFFSSNMAQAIWKFYLHMFSMEYRKYNSIASFPLYWKTSKPWASKNHVRYVTPFIILWTIWTSRNDDKHRQLKMSPYKIKINIDNLLRSLAKASLITMNREKSQVFEYFNLPKTKARKKNKHRNRKTCFWIKPIPP
ncbi:hypothetical protein KSP39_PZI010503 [Platanthera zijinensis]|uniref:Reverse transcriptase zinc-binding domain-containing protein n=1 Tax=Platanthera zijinensis TaxID=2320716 RepID=A0AAP0BHJ7_9ASPA